MKHERTFYHARWLFSGSHQEEPVANAVMEVQNGIIISIGSENKPGEQGNVFPSASHTNSNTESDTSHVQLGNAAIIPQLVNSHTHLEFSNLRVPLEPSNDFPGWIRSLIQHRRERTESTQTRISRGILESLQHGVRVLGEIVTEDWHNTLLTSDSSSSPNSNSVAEADLDSSRQKNALTIVMFKEFLGLDASRSQEIQAEAMLHVRELQSSTIPPISQTNVNCVPAFSPHAPYSIHPDLFSTLCTTAKECTVPVAMHLAETKAERVLIQQGVGPFQTLLEELGVWHKGLFPTGSLLDYLKQLIEVPYGLVIHGNDLNDEEIQFLAKSQSQRDSKDPFRTTVVYCPRTHAYFHHDPHPWQQLLSLGIPVALGTDSRSSNPDLSIWKELQWILQDQPAVSPSQMLDLVTLNGSKALGLSHRNGVLQAGHRADFSLIQLANRTETDPWKALWHPHSCPVSILQSQVDPS